MPSGFALRGERAARGGGGGVLRLTAKARTPSACFRVRLSESTQRKPVAAAGKKQQSPALALRSLSLAASRRCRSAVSPGFQRRLPVLGPRRVLGRAAPRSSRCHGWRVPPALRLAAAGLRSGSCRVLFFPGRLPRFVCPRRGLLWPRRGLSFLSSFSWGVPCLSLLFASVARRAGWSGRRRLAAAAVVVLPFLSSRLASSSLRPSCLSRRPSCSARRRLIAFVLVVRWRLRRPSLRSRRLTLLRPFAPAVALAAGSAFASSAAARCRDRLVVARRGRLSALPFFAAPFPWPGRRRFAAQGEGWLSSVCSFDFVVFCNTAAMLLNCATYPFAVAAQK